jgi:LysR family transcriptional regulator, glycine cleavage system transcriptional activator
MVHSSTLNLPPTECLLAALEAMRHGSFTAAALTLGVTHAAISRRVAGAEAWAGIRLFERHGRGVRPTVEGQRLLFRLQQSFDQINQLVDRSRRPISRSIVRIAVTPSFARFWLMPRLKLIESDDVQIEIVADHRNANLENEDIDIAIRYGRGGWGQGLETKLFNETLLPVKAEKSVAWPESKREIDLLKMPLLHSGDTLLWREWAKSKNIELRRKSSDRVFQDYASTIDAAIAGLGVALWNRGLHEILGGLIVRPRASSVASSLNYFLLQKTSRQSESSIVVTQRILAQRLL